MTLNIGVIGCGKQAPKHITGLLAAGDVEVTVADIDHKNAVALTSSHQVTAADSVEALFEDPQIAALSICTPTTTHAALIKRAVECGKHFICEKPLANDLKEAEDLARLVKKAGVIGMVGYIYRFAPAFEQAYEILGDVRDTGESAVLGRVTNAYLRIGGRGSHMAWKHKRESGGGAINEMLVHMLDLTHWFFGEPVDVQLLKAEQKWPSREIAGETIEATAEDWVLASMRSKMGVDTLIQADFITPAFTQYLEIQGENGSFMGSIQSDFPGFVFCSKAAGGYEAGKTVLDFGQRNLYTAQMGEFVSSVREGRQPLKCTIDDSVGVMRSLEYLSHANADLMGWEKQG